MDAHTQLELWHLLLGAIVTGVGTWGLVWRTFIVPAQQREVARAKWEAGMEARMKSGEAAFARHKDRDDELMLKLTAIEERLRHIEIQLGGSHGDG